MVSFDSDAALTYKGKANQMNIFEIGAVLIGLSALFGYINHRFPAPTSYDRFGHDRVGGVAVDNRHRSA